VRWFQGGPGLARDLLSLRDPDGGPSGPPAQPREVTDRSPAESWDLLSLRDPGCFNLCHSRHCLGGIDQMIDSPFVVTTILRLPSLQA
jgi:hypothetical protein